jgi:hypothetical protein
MLAIGQALTFVVPGRLSVSEALQNKNHAQEDQ